jgi:replicative DNA helicase
MLPGEVPPPHNPEAESAVLGAVLVDESAFYDLAQSVNAEDFFHPAHQKIMEALIHLSDKQIGIDPITLGNALRERGDFDSIGGMSFLSNLVSQAATSTSVEYYARIIRDKAAVRRMITVASTIVSEGYLPELDPEEFLDRAEARLMAAGEVRLNKGARVLREALVDAIARLERQMSDHTRTTGIPTGYKALDRMLSGLQNSDLLILAARPSMGKTSFALNLALNAASFHGYRHVLFASLEMAEPQITDRLLSIQAQVESTRLREGMLCDHELKAIHNARQVLNDVPIYIDDSPKLGVLELRAKARRLKQRNTLDLVMIDYLQLMDPSDKRVSREQQISEISRSLKAMAKEICVPVVALSQLSRAPETRGKDKRPLLSDLRDSGAIEQDADVVMFLYRPEYYDGDKTEERDRNLMEVIVAKQRNGPTGTARLTFMQNTMQVTDRMEDDPYQH